MKKIIQEKALGILKKVGSKKMLVSTARYALVKGFRLNEELSANFLKNLNLNLQKEKEKTKIQERALCVLNKINQMPLTKEKKKKIFSKKFRLNGKSAYEILKLLEKSNKIKRNKKTVWLVENE